MNKLLIHVLSSAIVSWAVVMSVVMPTSSLAASKKETAVLEALQLNLLKARPGLQVLEVVKSGVPDLYEAALNNGDTLYTTEDGKYIIAGKILRLDDDRLVDVMEERQKPVRAEAMKKLPLTDSINFPPPNGETKAVIHVFTDVDCGYCQKLHSHMAEMNALGIEVRYLAFPRAGPESISAKKLVNAWCSKDRQDAMNKLKARQNIPEANCINPMAAEYMLGQKIGVTGTPAVIREDGEMIGGYLSPDQMATALGI